MADQTVRIDVIARAQTAAFGKAGEDLRRFGKATESTAKDSSRAMTKLGNVAGVAGTAILLGVGAALAVGAKAAIDFESQFAGVRKTVDASEATFQRLATTLRGMALEIPIPVGDLTRIAELGGQLGIPVERLEEFTETVAKLGVTTELSTEEAATGIARLANVMGTRQTDFDNIASAVVDLGNNFATTEPEILNFGLRLAGIGSTIGLSEADVLGLAAAFTSLGEPAERGATAIQRTFVEIQKAVDNGGERLAIFAETAGMTSEAFAQMFKDDPAQAFIAFERGLAKINEEGGQVTSVLRDLGLDSQRTLGLLLKGAQGWEVLADAVGTASDAYSDNIALDEEAGKRFGTTASQITLMANSFKDLNIEIGQSTTGLINFAVGALAEFFTLIKDNQGVLEAIMTLVGILAAGKLLSKMGSAFISFGDKIGIFEGRLLGARSALKGFGTGLGLFSGILTGVIAIFAAVGLAVAANRQEMKKYQTAVSGTVDAIEELRKGTGEFTDVYEAMVTQLQQKNALFDITLDLEAERDFLANTIGITAQDFVRLAVEDFSGFQEFTDQILQDYVDAGADLTSKLDSPMGNLTFDEADIEEQERLANEYERFSRIVREVTVASAALRAEQELRREEFELELRAANDGRAFIDTWNRFGRQAAATTQVFISGLSVSQDEYQELLAEMRENTSEFVVDFLDEWGDLVGGFTDQLFDWGSAWNEYEMVTTIGTDKLRTSLENWTKDQQRLTDATLFVTENFASDMVEFWLTLPEDVQRVLAAALAESPELFETQFGLFVNANKDLLANALEVWFATASTAADRLGPQFLDFFEQTILPAAEAAGPAGSEGFINSLLESMAQFDQELATASPEIAGAFQGWIENIVNLLNMEGISTNAIQEITRDMTTSEKIAWFQSVGLSWEEASVLGWFSGDLASILAENAKDSADHIAANPELHDKFIQAGIAWKDKANTGWMMTGLSDPETKQLADAELNDKFYQAGFGWAKKAADGFKAYDMGGELADKVSQAASQANKAAETVWGMQSPSQVFMEYGRLVGEGFNMGLSRSLVGPAEQIFASLKPDMSQLAKVDRQTPALLNAIGGLANVGGSRETNVIFNGNVENEGEVMRKVQKGTALAGLTQIAETAPGRS